MKTTQYVRQERAIAAADKNTIRERWMYGLRLLRDPEKMTESGKSLRHGISDGLIAAAKQHGLKLSGSEIQRRIWCAKTYQKESQIARALGDFDSWNQLITAGFPAYDAPDGEPLADHRTSAERSRDRARDLLDRVGLQDSLFPLDQFEPGDVTLKDLRQYADEQHELTGRFVAHDVKRLAYLGRLIDAAGGDLSVTWEAAQALLPDDEVAA